MKTLFFWSSFRFTAKLRGRYLDFPDIPYTAIKSPTHNILSSQISLSNFFHLPFKSQDTVDPFKDYSSSSFSLESLQIFYTFKSFALKVPILKPSSL